LIEEQWKKVKKMSYYELKHIKTVESYIDLFIADDDLDDKLKKDLIEWVINISDLDTTECKTEEEIMNLVNKEILGTIGD
jgi:hypothetical protein